MVELVDDWMIRWLGDWTIENWRIGWPAGAGIRNHWDAGLLDQRASEILGPKIAGPPSGSFSTFPLSQFSTSPILRFFRVFNFPNLQSSNFPETDVFQTRRNIAVTPLYLLPFLTFSECVCVYACVRGCVCVCICRGFSFYLFFLSCRFRSEASGSPVRLHIFQKAIKSIFFFQHPQRGTVHALKL